MKLSNERDPRVGILMDSTFTFTTATELEATIRLALWRVRSVLQPSNSEFSFTDAGRVVQ